MCVCYRSLTSNRRQGRRNPNAVFEALPWQRTSEPIQSLRPVLIARISPPETLPAQFDFLRAAVVRLHAQTLPRPSPDQTKDKFISTPFSVEGIDSVKSHQEELPRICKGTRRRGIRDHTAGALLSCETYMLDVANRSRSWCLRLPPSSGAISFSRASTPRTYRMTGH